MADPIKQAVGVSVAMAVAGLVGCASNASDTANSSVAATGKTDLVHCYSANVCKGHNDCKTSANACAGMSSCKGTGFVAMPSKACADVGGELKDDYKGEISTADLVHCTDVNVCKGHNDCKTAQNSCAGQSSCKGTGFVSMPAKACGDIGGSS